MEWGNLGEETGLGVRYLWNPWRSKAIEYTKEKKVDVKIESIIYKKKKHLRGFLACNVL
jgi:hypothetical protein